MVDILARQLMDRVVPWIIFYLDKMVNLLGLQGYLMFLLVVG